MGVVARWRPKQELTEQEQHIVQRMERTGKLFAFLRHHRHELIDDAFQEELEAMYRQTGAGKEPVPPGLMVMAMILQGYMKASDATMVELTVFDLRVQMVLDCMGSTEPAFSQAALCEFRHRFIRHNMDRRLLEKSVEVAMRHKEFDPRKVKAMLRVAIDSRPLEGAGRVEDTLNLLGHAARKVVACVAREKGWPKEKVCREAGIPLLLEKSVKKGLDVDWNEAGQKARALQKLVKQLDAMRAWLKKHVPEEQLTRPPLSVHLATLEQIGKQDLEPDPEGGGGVRIRKEVAEDRRVSVEDGEMRHGRKSKSKRFNGYKQHMATDLDEKLILACAVTPANRPEAEATPELEKDMKQQKLRIDKLYIDRGYITSSVVEKVQEQGGEVRCKPWKSKNGELFSKSEFKLDMRSRTISCPGGQTQSFTLGTTVEFEAQVCDGCPLRAQCTQARPGQGRTVAIGEDEALQQRLRKLVKTPAGRQRLRERVGVEHRQAHLARRQGPRARYRGVRKNVFDLRRASCIQNLEAWQRRLEPSPAKVG
ncbi:IS1182 family transposase [Archangium sp.]|uniref:IS1182 family transposase n=1 Tax=Archangium sp. TaxID=1872627 RepID=UPI002D33DE25|nr:IS1182 family transposase [Archangium sp.]HYO51969.1 IS1182 family transposase [Archangium sp.]